MTAQERDLIGNPSSGLPSVRTLNHPNLSDGPNLTGVRSFTLGMEAYMKFYLLIGALAALSFAACSSSGTALPGSQTINATRTRGATSGYGYSVTDLGTLGGPVSGANSINNHNWASGFSTLASGSYFHAALWENGGGGI